MNGFPKDWLPAFPAKPRSVLLSCSLGSLSEAPTDFAKAALSARVPASENGRWYHDYVRNGVPHVALVDAQAGELHIVRNDDRVGPLADAVRLTQDGLSALLMALDAEPWDAAVLSYEEVHPGGTVTSPYLPTEPLLPPDATPDREEVTLRPLGVHYAASPDPSLDVIIDQATERDEIYVRITGPGGLDPALIKAHADMAMAMARVILVERSAGSR